MTSKLVLTAGLLAALVHSPVSGQPPARKIRFNGRELTSEQMARLDAVERRYNVRIRDAEYWYDNRSGATGVWNGPALAALPPGLELGGTMPANCSGGGTGVFINGREIHPLDLQTLSALGPVYPGR